MLADRGPPTVCDPADRERSIGMVDGVSAKERDGAVPDVSALGSLHLSVIREAIRQTPSLRYALGVAALGAVISLVTVRFGLDAKTAIVGGLATITFMFVLVVFNSIASGRHQSLRYIAIAMAWMFSLLLVGTCALLLSCLFWAYPRPLPCLLRSDCSSAAVAPHVAPISPAARADNPQARPSGQAADPPAPTVAQHVRTCLQKLAIAQDSRSGGIREVLDPKKKEGAWTTAQTLAAASSASLVGVTDPDLDAQRALDFLERQHRALPKKRAPRGAPEAGYAMFSGDDFYTVTEIQAWAIVAKSLQLTLSQARRSQLMASTARDVNELLKRQDESGGWSPVSVVRTSNTRTYTSIMALWALSEARLADVSPSELVREPIRKSAEWLLGTYNDRIKGWTATPDRRTTRLLSLTAHAIFALERTARTAEGRYLLQDPRFRAIREAFARDDDLLHRQPDDMEALDSTDTLLDGFPHPIEGSHFIWAPWALLAAQTLTADGNLSAEDRARAAAAVTRLRSTLAASYQSDSTWEFAESALCAALSEQRI
jgi:hypothetical protein